MVHFNKCNGSHHHGHHHHGRHHGHHHCGHRFPTLNYHNPKVSEDIDPRAGAIAYGTLALIGGLALAALGIGLCFTPGGQPPGITLAVVGGVTAFSGGLSLAAGIFAVILLCAE